MLRRTGRRRKEQAVELSARDGPGAEEDALALQGELPSDPALVVCCCARDEEDVLEAFIAFHLNQGADAVLVTEHGSVDGTRRVLERYAQLGRVAYLTAGGQRIELGAWMTRMARLAASRGARWIVNADADEFWMPRVGTLREVFALLPDETTVVHAYHRDFLPAPHAEGFDPDRQTVWDAGRDAAFYARTAAPKVAHRAGAKVRVADGNHWVKKLDGGEEPLGFLPIDILHFPVRSYEQLARKLDAQTAGWRHRDPPRHIMRLAELRASGGLREYYERATAPEAIAAGLAGGRLGRDERLAAFLEGVRTGGDYRIPARRPFGASAAQAVARELGSALDARSLRDEARRRSADRPALKRAPAGESDPELRRRFLAEVFERGRFSADWFSKNVPVWEPVVGPLAGADARVLEIGSYEGLSACYVLWRLPRAELTCVDTFAGNEEHRDGSVPVGDGVLSSLEAAFDANVALFAGERAVRKLVSESAPALVELARAGERFDLVYVDGSHRALDVLADAVLAWPLVRPGGLIVFDDYRWKAGKRRANDPLGTPRPAVDAFVGLVRSESAVEFAGRQVCLRKTDPARRRATLWRA